MTDQRATEEATVTGDAERWPLGCQARPWLQTWGVDGLRQRLPEVMARLSAIGFAGFETTLAALPLDDPPAFADAAARAGGIALCGGHAGGAWWDADAAVGIDPLAARASRLPALGCERLVVSMQTPPPVLADEEIARIVANLDRLGRACRAGGVAVVFHNHAAELADDARVLAAIAERCDPDAVALGPDLGWVARGGADVPAFVQRFGPRIAYAHVRDITAVGAAGRFTEVGRGVLDQRAILEALAAAGYAGWLVAESEFGDGWQGATEPAETARRQFDGLRAVLAPG